MFSTTCLCKKILSKNYDVHCKEGTTVVGIESVDSRSVQNSGRWWLVGKKFVGPDILSKVKLEGKKSASGGWSVAGGMVGLGSFPTNLGGL